MTMGRKPNARILNEGITDPSCNNSFTVKATDDNPSIHLPTPCILFVNSGSCDCICNRNNIHPHICKQAAVITNIYTGVEIGSQSAERKNAGTHASANSQKIFFAPLM